MKRIRTVAMLCAGVAIFAATPSFAQRSSEPIAASQSGTLSAEERADQLKAVVRDVTSPDRDLNIAKFEQLMESGDARRIEIAIRTLVSSDDAILRGMAMRGYVAVTRDLVLETVLSPVEMKVLTAARAEPNGLSNLRSPYGHLRQLAAVGFKIPLMFEITSIKEPHGKVMVPQLATVQGYNAVYSVRGDRITFGIQPINGWVKCEFELAPKKDATIVATMSCPHSDFSAPVAFIAPMF